MKKAKWPVVLGAAVLIVAGLSLSAMLLRAHLGDAPQRQQELEATVVSRQALQELVDGEVRAIRDELEEGVSAIAQEAIYDEMERVSREDIKAMAGESIKSSLRQWLSGYGMPSAVLDSVDGVVDHWIGSEAADKILDSEFTQSVVRRTVSLCVEEVLSQIQIGGDSQELTRALVDKIDSSPLYHVGFSPVRLKGPFPYVLPLRSLSYYNCTVQRFWGIPYDVTVHGWDEELIGAVVKLYVARNTVMDLPDATKRAREMDYAALAQKAASQALGEELQARWNEILNQLWGTLKAVLPQGLRQPA